MDNEVREKLKNAMSVRDLIEKLEAMSLDAKVLFACDYGDHGRTEQVLTVGNLMECESSDLEETGYSRSGVAFIQDDEDGFRPDSDDDSFDVIILRSHPCHH